MPLGHATLWPKIVQIGPKLFKSPDTENVDHSSYYELFIENIGQSVRYIIEFGESFSDNSMPVCQKWVESDQ